MISDTGVQELLCFFRDHRDKARILRDNAQKEIDAYTKERRNTEAVSSISKYSLFEGMFQAYDDAVRALMEWRE